MRETTVGPIKRIVTLVESVHQAAQLFASTVDERDEPAFQRFVEKIQEKTERFEFELQSELTRLSAGPADVSGGPEINVRMALERMLGSYQQALASNITPHARAMVNRQFEEMRKEYEEFASLHRAAA